MRGSFVLWSLMASAPAFLLGVLGIVGRTQISTWEFEAYSPQQTKDLLEYQPLVRASSRLQVAEKMGPRVEAAANSAADKWLRLEAAGKLKDVLPGSMSDQGSLGAKSQIIDARQTVINLLTYISYEKKRQGRDFESVMASAKALAVADIFKYSGSATLQLSGMSQASLLRSIRGLWPNLTEKEKIEARRLLRRAYRPDEPVLLLAERLSHLSIRSKMRLGQSMPNLSTVFQVSQLKDLAQREVGSTISWGPEAEDYGLDTTFSNIMSAALRVERRLQQALADMTLSG